MRDCKLCPQGAFDFDGLPFGDGGPLSFLSYLAAIAPIPSKGSKSHSLTVMANPA